LYDEGNGFMDVRKFLVDIMPTADIESNPFIPKDKVQLMAQVRSLIILI
jgi:hypothetical protein